ncbi:MAG: hypothetical protein ACRDRA_01355, partial [Pseudonocardiaceae bacterium]
MPVNALVTALAVDEHAWSVAAATHPVRPQGSSTSAGLPASLLVSVRLTGVINLLIENYSPKLDTESATSTVQT